MVGSTGFDSELQSTKRVMQKRHHVERDLFKLSCQSFDLPVLSSHSIPLNPTISRTQLVFVRNEDKHNTCSPCIGPGADARPDLRMSCIHDAGAGRRPTSDDPPPTQNAGRRHGVAHGPRRGDVPPLRMGLRRTLFQPDPARRRRLPPARLRRRPGRLVPAPDDGDPHHVDAGAGRRPARLGEAAAEPAGTEPRKQRPGVVRRPAGRRPEGDCRRIG